MELPKGGFGKMWNVKCGEIKRFVSKFNSDAPFWHNTNDPALLMYVFCGFDNLVFEKQAGSYFFFFFVALFVGVGISSFVKSISNSIL